MKKTSTLIEDFVYSRIVKPLLYTSRLGRKSMFGYADTGLNFDHIYQNKAKGYSRFGKVVDRVLLNLPACKATRNRKDTVIRILREEIDRNIARGKKTRIVDLASGPARYLVDLVTPDIEKEVEVLCFDIDAHALNYGRKIATSKPILYRRSNVLKLGLHHIRFAEKKHWIPNIIVASGFYEYIDDDLSVHTLKVIKDSLDKDGLLLLITQRNSPNKKLIEKVGVTKSGKRWVLFYREPRIIEKWLNDLDFKDIQTYIDPWNMYMFFQARRN